MLRMTNYSFNYEDCGELKFQDPVKDPRFEMHLEVEFLGTCGQAMPVPPLNNTLLWC